MSRPAWLAAAAMLTGFGAGVIAGVWSSHRPWATAIAPPVAIDRAIRLSEDVEIAIGRAWLAGEELRFESIVANSGEDDWRMGGAATPLLHDDRGRVYPGRRMSAADRSAPAGGRSVMHYVFQGPLAPGVEKVHLTFGDLAILADIPVDEARPSQDLLVDLRELKGEPPRPGAPSARPTSAAAETDALRDMAEALGAEIVEARAELSSIASEIASLERPRRQPGGPAHQQLAELERRLASAERARKADIAAREIEREQIRERMRGMIEKLDLVAELDIEMPESRLEAQRPPAVERRSGPAGEDARIAEARACLDCAEDAR